MSNPFGDENSTYFRYDERDKASEVKKVDDTNKNKFVKYLNPVFKALLYLFILVVSFILFSINAIIYNAKNDVEESIVKFNTDTISVYNNLDNRDMIDSLEEESKNKNNPESAESSFVVLQMKQIIDEEYVAGRVGIKEGMSTTQAIENVAPYFAVCDSLKYVDNSLPNMQELRRICLEYEDSANTMMDSIVKYNYFSKESIIGVLSFGNNVKYPDIKSADIDDVGIFSDKINNR